MPMTRRVSILPATVLALALGLAACGSSDGGGNGGEASGAEVYSSSCARCHGGDGQGGVGPALGGGAVVDRFGDIDDQIRVIAEGVGGMPAFGGSLSPEEIRAVAVFEREDLSG